MADAFELELEQGKEPQIEEFVRRLSPDDYDLALLEFVAVEAAWRRRRGQIVDPEAYFRRFPELARVRATRTPDPLASLFDDDRPPWEASPAGPPAGVPSAEAARGSDLRQIGRYRVVRTLGRGTFGEVFEADDPDLRRRVALKVPRPDARFGAGDAARFRREGQILARLRHPGLVSVFDTGVGPDGRPFIVSELVDGEDLAARLGREGRLPAEVAVRIVAEAAEALAEAHKAGVVHRDVKPANILLDRTGRVRVADFGMAMPEEIRAQARGEISGSPAYMAPEQLAGKAHFLDGRADVWALGVVLYECLTGNRPFTSASIESLAEEVSGRAHRPVRQLDPEAPPELDRVIDRCLAKEPVGRYPSATDLAVDLRSAVEGRNRDEPPPRIVGAAPAVRPPVAQLRSFLRAGWVAAAVAALAGVCLTGWSVLLSDRESAEGPVEPLSVRVTNEAIPGRRGRSVVEMGVLPLIPGDEVVIEVDWPEPRYLYVVWFGSDQPQPLPIYPWTDMSWSKRPAQERLLRSLSLPVGMVNPTPATETVLALGAVRPLPGDFDLASLVAAAPTPEFFRSAPAAGAAAGDGVREVPNVTMRGLTVATRGLTPAARPPRELKSLADYLHKQLDRHGIEFRVLSFPSGMPH